MKKWLIVLMCVVITGCTHTRVSIVDDFPKIKRVAVLSFEPRDSAWGRLYANHFTMELVKLKKFEVIERTQLDKILQEQLLDQSGVINRETLLQIGKILGIEAVFLGSCVRHGGRGLVSVRLVEIQTGRIIWSGTSTNPKKLVKTLK